jgi:hypothetical protein
MILAPLMLTPGCRLALLLETWDFAANDRAPVLRGGSFSRRASSDVDDRGRGRESMRRVL